MKKDSMSFVAEFAKLYIVAFFALMLGERFANIGNIAGAVAYLIMVFVCGAVAYYEVFKKKRDE